MATSACGRRTVAFQVKTSRNAYRKRRYGCEGYEWDVNRDVIGKHHESFWYAFIDLREKDGNLQPEVFLVPSRWVAEFVKADFGRFLYFLSKTSADEFCREKWNFLTSYLTGGEEGLRWANEWPEETLTKWRT